MNAHLNHILAQQRIAALQRAADHARLATNAGTRRRDSRDCTAQSGAPGKESVPVLISGHGDELRSMAFSQPQKAPAAVEQSEQLTRLVYEPLDAHAGTEHLSLTQSSELLWHAHLRHLRDLQRVGREVLADVS